MNNIYSIIGPTASGKSALAEKVVKHLLKKKQEVILVSLDSKQIYQALPILSGADLSLWQDLKNRITIYNLADKSITDEWSLGLLVAQMQEILAHLTNQQTIILVGGTLLYHQKILNQNDLTQIPPNDNLRLVAENMNLIELQNWLKRISPSTWKKLNHSDSHNPRRLIRKIEIEVAKCLHQTKVQIDNQAYNQQEFFLTNYEQHDLFSKIKDRVQARWAQGAISEVEKIIQSNPKLINEDQFLEKMPLGFIEIKNYLLKEVAAEAAIKQWQIKEIQYAKRQIVFLKKLLANHPHLVDQRKFFSN